jgi:hypothetical protein
MIVQEVALPVLRVGLANLIISGLNVINGEASSRFCLVL